MADYLSAYTGDQIDAAIETVQTSNLAITPEQCGAVGDGVTDDQEALQEAMRYAVTNGVPLRATGDYGIASTIKVEFVGHLMWDFTGAKISALSGFPGSKTRMIDVTGGTSDESSFSWIGGHYDCQNQPREGTLSGNDMINISVSSSARAVRFHPERLYAGEDYRTSGGDTLVTINADDVDLNIGHAQGAQDLAVYITSSSGSTATRKGQLKIGGHFAGCRRAVSVKRGTQNLFADITVEDCEIGWTSAPADVEGETYDTGTDTAIVRVSAMRCNHPVSDTRGNGILYHVTATDMGNYFAADEDSGAAEVIPSDARMLFKGTQNCTMHANIHGINQNVIDNDPNWSRTGFYALNIDASQTGEDAVDAHDNLVIINCSGFAYPVVENYHNPDAYRNTILWKAYDCDNDARIEGEGSKSINLDAITAAEVRSANTYDNGVSDYAASLLDDTGYKHQLASDGTGGWFQKLYHFGGSQVFGVLNTGDVQNQNNSYGATSDERLKENIVAATSQWDDVKAMQFRKFNFIGSDVTQLGVIAQELEAAGMDGLVSEDEDGTKSVKYSVLTLKCLVALQEAMARIEALEGTQ